MAGKMIEFRVNDRTARGYLATPAAGAGPGIVVIQEWWGLVDHIKKIADRFAAEGFVALAPDLFHGETPKSQDQAGKLMMALRVDEAEKDLRGAIRYLLDNPAVTSRKVGTIGFCMGGALSLYAASQNPEVGACVVFYGGHPNIKPDLANLEAPVLGIYGERDKWITPEVVRDLEQKLKSLGKQVEIHMYPADHAFFNDDRKEVYNPQAAADAWQRTIEFVQRHLR